PVALSCTMKELSAKSTTWFGPTAPVVSAAGLYPGPDAPGKDWRIVALAAKAPIKLSLAQRRARIPRFLVFVRPQLPGWTYSSGLRATSSASDRKGSGSSSDQLLGWSRLWKERLSERWAADWFVCRRKCCR